MLTPDTPPAGSDTSPEISYRRRLHSDYRIEYLKAHILAMMDAVEIDGVEIMGYTFKRYIGWGIEANIQCLKEKRGEK